MVDREQYNFHNILVFKWSIITGRSTQFTHENEAPLLDKLLLM